MTVSRHDPTLMPSLCGRGAVRQTVADGRRVLLRPARTQDRDLYVTAVRSLSPRARYQRFFAPKEELLDPEVNRLMNLDPAVQVVWFAVDETDRVGLGVARCAVVVPGVGEVALAVVDAYQGLGLGGVLLDRVISAARESGIVTFTAESLEDNEVIARLLRSRGFTAVGLERGVISWRLALPG
jgi:GNAT superfamily N-acetyltransferase